MAKRAIIEIDRDKCNGCGLCTTACAEGALILDEENKAVLVKEIYCDGLGACLDVCPVDALRVVERDVADYDAVETFKHVKNVRGEEAALAIHGIEEVLSPKSTLENIEIQKSTIPHQHLGGCPGSMAREFTKKESVNNASTNALNVGNSPSELSQWPIQLHLVSPFNPAFNDSDLLVAADCTAFSLGAFHNTLLKNKKIVIACPKLDETAPYVDKLAALIANNTIYSLTVAIMSVPCCSGLASIVDQAVAKSGKNIAVRKVVVAVEGEILS